STVTTANSHRRLWPMPQHTALVWQALVNLCKTTRDLELLYSDLVREARGIPPADTSLPTRPPSQAIDAAHFTPFIKAFTNSNSSTTPIDVLRHMMSLGTCEPDIYQLTALAGEHAAAGRVNIVMAILDWMDNAAFSTSASR